MNSFNSCSQIRNQHFSDIRKKPLKGWTVGHLLIPSINGGIIIAIIDPPNLKERKWRGNLTSHIMMESSWCVPRSLIGHPSGHPIGHRSMSFFWGGADILQVSDRSSFRPSLRSSSPRITLVGGAWGHRIINRVILNRSSLQSSSLRSLSWGVPT